MQTPQTDLEANDVISRAEALRLAGLSAAKRKAAKDAEDDKGWAMNNVRDKGKAYDKEHDIPDNMEDTRGKPLAAERLRKICEDRKRRVGRKQK
ncbi:hypothetical protein CEUSTIGMA_g11377.t1 [Chlamydomonas eustigma]|uniref:Uncharacterized protein n=1 Tax=Chlamydomonas eustigma TaxID=1157962 RepID=A0A250XLP4_9CHLO|nr:hypothetical protein CEUSTIGMA_g11377.t1 [Chlamydomonas eustigma]|eukprot:GAX83953.1 hypothetical protein CEUSTIGMA_g11377.t1 [Chlamydomonas eustigma]